MGFEALADIAAAGLSASSALAIQRKSWKQQQEVMDWNANQAQINRDFQLGMSSTAYQRGVADMKKAGLNPLLAAGGGGASTTSGSQASVSSAPRHDENALTRSIHSGLEARRIRKEVAQTNANIALTKQQARLASNSAAKAHHEATLLKTSVPAAKIQAQADQTTAKFNKTNAYSDSWLKRIRQFIPFTGSAHINTKK